MVIKIGVPLSERTLIRKLFLLTGEGGLYDLRGWCVFSEGK